jgi:transcriptional regulator with XRE-family HTH domain
MDVNGHQGNDSTFLSGLLSDRGLTVEGLSRRLKSLADDGSQPDASLVWKWVNARTRPSSRYLALLASVLGVEPQMLKDRIQADYENRNARARTAESPTFQASIPLDISFPPEGLIDRRVVVKAFLLSDSAGAMTDIYQSVNHNTLNTAAAEGLVIATEHLGRNFDRYNIFELQKQLEFHMSFVGRHLREALTVNQRTLICSNGSRLAAMAASVAFLTGSVNTATVLDDIAFRLAREVSDRSYSPGAGELSSCGVTAVSTGRAGRCMGHGRRSVAVFA